MGASPFVGSALLQLRHHAFRQRAVFKRKCPGEADQRRFEFNVDDAVDQVPIISNGRTILTIRVEMGMSRVPKLKKPLNQVKQINDVLNLMSTTQSTKYQCLATCSKMWQKKFLTTELRTIVRTACRPVGGSGNAGRSAAQMGPDRKNLLTNADDRENPSHPMAWE